MCRVDRIRWYAGPNPPGALVSQVLNRPAPGRLDSSVSSMAFLGNDAIRRVNLHSGIHALAQSGGFVFFVVYLVRSGVPVPMALGAMAVILAVRSPNVDPGRPRMQTYTHRG